MIMLRRLTLLSLAGLLAAPACIIDADDDDGADSANDTGMSSTTSSASTASSGPPATGQETAGQDTTATAGGGACGWGQTGDDVVPEGYICGGDGADPSEMFPMACPEGVMLEVGGECGDIEGPGCCDPDGNAWFCGDAGDGPVLARIEC